MQAKESTYYPKESMFHGAIHGIMGTEFEMLIIDGNRTKLLSLWNEITDTLYRLDTMLSRFNSIGELGRLNAHASKGYVSVSKELKEVLTLCGYYHNNTYGLFDVTLKNWGAVSLKGDSVTFTDPGLRIDLGGFGKGYALRKISRLFDNYDITHAITDFGHSSIMARGHHPYGAAWKIGLVNPFKTDITLEEFELKNTSLSTSGNSPVYWGHIINPKNGLYNVERSISAVLASDPLDAEVLSTVWTIANDTERNGIKQRFANIQITSYNL